MANLVGDLKLGKPPIITFNHSIQDALTKMKIEGTDYVLVEPYAASGALRIFTFMDKFRIEGEGGSNMSPVGTYSNEITYFVTPESSLTDCKAKMAAFRIRHLPVFSDAIKSRLIGVVCQEDLL